MQKKAKIKTLLLSIIFSVLMIGPVYAENQEINEIKQEIENNLTEEDLKLLDDAKNISGEGIVDGIKRIIENPPTMEAEYKESNPQKISLKDFFLNIFFDTVSYFSAIIKESAATIIIIIILLIGIGILKIKNRMNNTEINSDEINQ